MPSYLKKLKEAESLSDLAKIVGFKPKALSYILYKIQNEEKYCTFEIPKKNGGTRRIQAPIPKLKTLQQRIKNVLYSCCDELKSPNRKTLSHGFKKTCSIHTNAKIHKNKRYVLNFDIKNFFQPLTLAVYEVTL